MVNSVSGGSGSPSQPFKPAATNAADGITASQTMRPAYGSSRTESLASAALTAQSTAGIARDMAEAPPVDLARVAALKADIAAGRYTADPDRIADAMIRSEQIDRSS